MNFDVKFSNCAVKFLKKLPEDILERIKSKFRDLSVDPFRYLEHFEGEDYYKFRVGDYRALVEIDFDKKVLWIRVFDKRGRVYK